MTTPNPPAGPPLLPDYDPKERELLTSLGFFLGEISRFHDRGLIAEDAYRTIVEETSARRESIEKTGHYRAARANAVRLRSNEPVAALYWAEQARAVDPANRETWELSIELLRKVGENEKALAICEEGMSRFSDLPITPEQIRAEIATLGEIQNLLTEARSAIEASDDERAIKLTEKIREIQPDHYDAIVIQAFARQRSNDNSGALSLYKELRRREPANPVWAKWIAELNRRTTEVPILEPFSSAKKAKLQPGDHELPVPVKVEPSISWGEVAGEFLQDHWQKLILCLAVLLIVVSSNVGAYQVLGERLWYPEGKCLLALVYTAMFALFGAGLVRWGAERAGRIMLLTTLIVVPANFMLAGQMKLLTEPSSSRLTVLGVDAVALFLLIRLVATSLKLPRGSGFLSIALFALSMFNAGASQGSPWPWPLQFAIFLAPAFVYLGSVVWVTTGFQAGSFEDRRETTYFALALLTFAFLTGLVRTGIFALELIPTFYAIPVALLAVAGIRTSRAMPLFDPEPQRIAWMRFAAVIVSGLAFSLALARPPGDSALFSANTLVTALIGLTLYSVLLWKERTPAYLYFAFGAMLLAYFGIYYFVHPRMHFIEDALKYLAGYSPEQKLPAPFKAVNGLIFNPFLAGLSILFARRWNDPRLARHCHYVGVPFSIAACVLSGFEPKAALICLSGYAVLYAIAVPIFATPWLTYLSTAALAGAVYFGTTLIPGMTLAQQGLIASLIGLAYWSIGPILSWRGVDASYRRPFGHAALAMTALAIFASLSSVFQMEAVHLPAALALLIVAGIGVLVNREEPSRLLGYYAVISGNLGLIFLSIWAGARWGHGPNPAEFAMACAVIGFVGALLGNRIAYPGGSSPSLAFSVYPEPLVRSAAIQVLLTLLAIGIHVVKTDLVLGRPDFAILGFAFGFAGLTLALLSRPYPGLATANLALGCGLGVWICAFQVMTGAVAAKSQAYGAIVSVYSLLLIAIEELAEIYARRRERSQVVASKSWLPEPRQFATALPWFALGTIAIALFLCLIGGENDLAVIFTLLASAFAMFWSTRLRPVAIRVDAANVLTVLAAFCFTAWLFPNDNRIQAWNALTCVIVSLGFLAAWRYCSPRQSLVLYRNPLLRGAGILTLLVFLSAIAGRSLTIAAYPIAASALAFNLVPCVLLSRIRRQVRQTYRAIGSAVAAVYVVVFSVGEPRPENAYILGLVAVILSLVLSAIGFVLRRFARDNNEFEDLHALPSFLSSFLLVCVGIWIAYTSPLTMVLAGLAFLVYIKGIPSRLWLYPTVGSLVCALYHGVLIHWPEPRLAVAALGIGFSLWMIALLTRHAEPFLSSLLKLENEGYDTPLFNSALIAATAGGWMRFVATIRETVPPSDSAGMALGLAVFAILMIKPYPARLWAHLAAGFATLSAVLATYQRMGTDPWWVTLGMGLALVFVVVTRGLEDYGHKIYGLAGVPDMGYPDVPRYWSRGLFAVSSALITCIVVGTLGLTVLETIRTPITGQLWAWGSLEIALAMGAVYILAAWRRTHPTSVMMGLTWVTVMAVWWIAAPSSPLVADWKIAPLTFLPLATGVLSCGILAAGLQLSNQTAPLSAFLGRVPDDELLARLNAFALQAGLGLALVAVILTRGTIDNTTVGTLLLATAGTGMASIAKKWIPGAYATGLFWCAGAAYGVLDATNKLHVVGSENVAIFLSLGLLIALAVLMVVAGSLRRGDEPTDEHAMRDVPARTVAIAFEHVAALAWLFAGLTVVASPFFLGKPDTTPAATAVGILFGLTLATIAFIARWRDERLVYPAHATLVGAYLYYRWAFPLPAATDAVVLTLFGYLNLGLAEVMERVGLGRYAKPTKYASLLIPLLPIALSILGQWEQGGVRIDDIHLFILFSAATFYAIACYSIKWRWLGYAAAVLYNAFLWFLWSRIGYTFSDRPQFFLIPVGLSAILFAEDNRRSLGKDAVNLFRGVGLTLIYLSLAAPIWQAQSLGAWVTLLLLSLAGIFVGIGLRVQVFLWFGLVTFVLDVVYQLGKMGAESSLAKWGIMLVLGIGLVLFVALNEKKKIVESLKVFYDDARGWE